MPDAVLLTMVRDGDDTAYAALWRRYRSTAIAVALRTTRTFDAEDVAAEAFARILAAIRAGGGPRIAFRAYLLVTVKNVIANWGRQEARMAMISLDLIEELPVRRHVIDVGDRLAVVSAFRTLPERWQLSLWYSEIEGLGPSEIGTLLGISSSAAAMLTYRARIGLREAWHSENGASRLIDP
jgi:RNA polymerase sigma factor (sigma-70 family)